VVWSWAWDSGTWNWTSPFPSYPWISSLGSSQVEDSWLWVSLTWGRIRIIRKVRKTQHQNPEFGHKPGEIKNKSAKKYIQGGETQKTIHFCNKLSFILSFLFPKRLHCCYIYVHCSYLYNSYNYSRTLCIWSWDLIKFPYFADTTERGVWGWKAPPKTGWRQGDFTDNSIDSGLLHRGMGHTEPLELSHGFPLRGYVRLGLLSWARAVLINVLESLGFEFLGQWDWAS